jgi:hypothetical protein
VFSAVPRPNCNVKNGRVASYGLKTEPALLLTDDCFLDKRVEDKYPMVKRLNFAPIWSMAGQKYVEAKAADLRGGALNPADVVYIDLHGLEVLEGETEGVALLSETFTIKASHFELEPVEAPKLEVTVDPTRDRYRHAIGPHSTSNNRVVTMELAEKRLLQEKLSYFWTRSELEPVCSTCWEPIDEVEENWKHAVPGRDGDHDATPTASLTLRPDG